MYDIVSCEELVELATEYFESALDPEARLRFERHMAICPPCRGFLSQMRKTSDIAASVPRESLSEPAKAALLSAYRDWKVGR